MSPPLVLRCPSAAAPLVLLWWQEKTALQNALPPGPPWVLRWTSVVAPPQTVQKTKRTTYPLDRYDST